LDYFEQSLRISQKLNALILEGEALTGLGNALMGLGELGQATSPFQRVADLGQKSDDQQLVVQALAGLAQIALVQKDLPQAQRHIEKILSLLENVTLYEPFRIYLTCFKVLNVNGDTRAGEVLMTAHTLLREQAAKIKDEPIRRSFLKNVKVNREIVETWERLHQGW
jgi:tetratricopeptide (TPR) repeat protein